MNPEGQRLLSLAWISRGPPLVSAMDRSEHHLSAAKLETAVEQPPKATHGDLVLNIRQPVAAGANERSRIIRGAPASFEDQPPLISIGARPADHSTRLLAQNGTAEPGN